MLRRTLVSLLATAGFVVLAFGSGSGTPKPTARVSVPALSLDEPATLTVDVDNQTDASFAWTSVRLEGQLARAVRLDSVGSATPQAMQAGDGWQAAASGNVAIGAQAQVSLDVTPRVPGKFEGTVLLCDAGGTCARASATATIPGAPQDLRQIVIDPSEPIAVGTPFTLTIDVRNNGTLPDELTEITLPKALMQHITVDQVTPMPATMKDVLDKKELTFDRGLQPDEVLSIVVQATPTQAGGVTDQIEVCGPGGMFDCEDVDFAITIQ